MPNRDAPPAEDRPSTAPESPDGNEPPENDRAAKRAQFERDMKALTPEHKQNLMRVNRYVFGFGAGALVSMIGLTLPLPWPAVGLAAIVASLVLAIRGIILAKRTPLAKGVVVYLAMGVALLGMFAIYSVPLIITWGDQWEYQQCVGQTQTIEGQDACQAQLEQATKSDWAKILRQFRQ
ncbi:MAG: hypothetical protein LBS27_00690 [Bifidobacteriaceae bacterium]|nr:hypothetical protein [Bifidobacteriaceae bacterium]